MGQRCRGQPSLGSFRPSVIIDISQSRSHWIAKNIPRADARWIGQLLEHQIPTSDLLNPQTKELQFQECADTVRDLAFPALLHASSLDLDSPPSAVVYNLTVWAQPMIA